MSRAGRRYTDPAPAPTRVERSALERSDAPGDELGRAPAGRPLFSVRAASASLANGANETLDFTSDLRAIAVGRGLDPSRWQIVSAYADSQSTGLGPISLDTFRAEGFDLAHGISSRRSVVPIGAPLPPNWAGGLTVRATNHTGAAGILYVTFWFGEAP